MGVDEVVCTNCGEPNPGRARFCLACGTPLDGADPASRRLVTVVFADVVGSTELGERLDPEPLRELLLAAFRRVEDVVDHHGGTVEKFIGDAVMAVFGIPTAHEDDALRAVRAAVEMREAVAGSDHGVAARHGVRLRLRIGVNTGEVMTGGGRQTLVTGDAVNLAARLEQHAAPGEILVGPMTASLLGDLLFGDPTAPLAVKGKRDPVTATRVRALQDRPPRAVAGLRSAGLVGRSAEVAHLEAVLDDAIAAADARVVTVVGGPGVGKSRLVDECLGRWGDRIIPFVGRCPPYGRGITYWPVREAVLRRVREVGGPDADPGMVLGEFLGEFLDDETAGRGVAAEVLGFVGLQPDAQVGDGASAVRTLLEATSRRRPLVVVLDDAQWAEPGLRVLVEHVLRWWHGGALVAIVVARPVDDTAIAVGTDWPDVDVPRETIRLDDLDRAAADQLATSLMPGATAAQRAAIVRAAGGNPLFVEELARVAADSPADRLPDLPAGVRTLLAARLDQLLPPRRLVLQRAAVIGETFEQASLRALTDRPEIPALAGHVAALARADLLRPEPGGGVERHAFRHLLARDVAYDALPKRDRARLHHRLADWMEEVADVRHVELDGLVGHHLEQAADLAAQVGDDPADVSVLTRRAGRALHRGGLQAQARGDVPGALNLLSRAAERLEDDDELPLVLGTLGSALTEAGDLDRAGTVLDRAVTVARERDDEQALVHAVLFRLWWQSAAEPAGWAGHAKREAERAVAVASRLGDDLGMARAWVVLAEVAWSAGRFATVEHALGRATTHARAAGDPREEVENVAALTATAVEGPLPVPDGIARCRRTLVDHGTNRSVRARTLRSLGLLQAMAGDPVARDTVEDSVAAFADLGQAYWLAVTTGSLGRVRWLLGDPAGAVGPLAEALARLEDLGDRSQWARVAALLARARVVSGTPGDAADLVTASRDAADVDDLEPQVGWRLAAAATELAAGRAEAALAVASEAADLVAATDALPWRAETANTLADAATAAGQHADAAKARAELARLREAKGLRTPSWPVSG